MSPGRTRILGWIKPDDGVSVPAGVADYECFRLEPWLQARGVAGVRVLEASLGRPLMTANQATLWKGLTLLEVPPAVPRGGRLLAAVAR